MTRTQGETIRSHARWSGFRHKVTNRRRPWPGIIATILAACLGLGCAAARKSSSASLPAGTSAPAPALAQGASQPMLLVDIGQLLGPLDALPMEQREHQLADWAAFATLAHEGLDGAALLDTMVNRTVWRRQEFLQVLPGENDDGTHVVLDDGRVWILYAKNDPWPRTTIARQADRIRMELGSIPREVELLRYTADLLGGKMQIERLSRVKGSDLFSREYGYSEHVFGDVDGLEKALAAIDDLTFVEALPRGEIRVGGRRMAKGPALGLGLEDVAALYQAQVSRPPALGFSLDPSWNLEGLKRDLATLRRSPELIVAEAEAVLASYRKNHSGQDLTRVASPWPVRAAALLEEATTETLPHDGTGKNKRRLAEAIKPLLPRLEPILAEIAEAGKAEENRYVRSFAGLLAELGQRTDPGAVLLRGVLAFVEGKQRRQCANYLDKGALAGTPLGMTLFYTDLVAKLWGFMDYGGGTPLGKVPGFVTLPRLFEDAIAAGISVEPQNKLDATRLWFGVRPNAATAFESSCTMAFAHSFTRVYAAASSSAAGNEMPTVGATKAAIDFFDTSLGQIARYEPQYDRLNQAMKWSLATACLVKDGYLPGLKDRKIERGLALGPWRQKHAELRFQDALDVSLPGSKRCGGEELDMLVSRPVIQETVTAVKVETEVVAGRKIQHTTTDKHVHSDMWRGGVSLIPRWRRHLVPPVAVDVPPALRRAGVRRAEATAPSAKPQIEIVTESSATTGDVKSMLSISFDTDDSGAPRMTATMHPSIERAGRVAEVQSKVVKQAASITFTNEIPQGSRQSLTATTRVGGVDLSLQENHSSERKDDQKSRETGGKDLARQESNVFDREVLDTNETELAHAEEIPIGRRDHTAARNAGDTDVYDDLAGRDAFVYVTTELKPSVYSAYNRIGEVLVRPVEGQSLFRYRIDMGKPRHASRLPKLRSGKEMLFRLPVVGRGGWPFEPEGRRARWIEILSLRPLPGGRYK